MSPTGERPLRQPDFRDARMQLMAASMEGLGPAPHKPAPYSPPVNESSLSRIQAPLAASLYEAEGSNPLSPTGENPLRRSDFRDSRMRMMAASMEGLGHGNQPPVVQAPPKLERPEYKPCRYFSGDINSWTCLSGKL